VFDQLTEKFLTGRTGTSTKPPEVKEDVALEWLMEIQDASYNPLQEAGLRPGGREELTQEMLSQCGISSSRRPSREEINQMAQRIAETRHMSSSQEQAVRVLLADIADQLFKESHASTSSVARHSVPAGQTSQLRALVATSMSRRPNRSEIKQMARSIGQSSDGDEERAMQLLHLMSDTMFGSTQSRLGGPTVDALLPHVQPPSPRTLENITRKVVARTGRFARKEEVRQMLTGLTDSLFRKVNTGHVPGDSARSSARSRTDSEDGKQNLNAEVHGLLMELCGALFNSSP